jgi:hypothetical protein
MRSELEIKAYFEGALVWTDTELTEAQKIQKFKSWSGLEFSCRFAIRDEFNRIICCTDGECCVPEILKSYMHECSYFSPLPSSLSQVIKAQSLQSQAIITQECNKSLTLKPTDCLQVIRDDYRPEH